MAYIFTQLLFQVPIWLFASLIGLALFEPAVQTNAFLAAALCFGLAPAIAYFSLYAHNRVNNSFGLSETALKTSASAVSFGLLYSAFTLSILLILLYKFGVAKFDFSRITPVNVVLGVGVGLISAPLEEIIFRGVLQRRLTDKLGKSLALFVSASVFSLAHASNPGYSTQTFFVLTTFSMAFLGSIFWLTENLLACVSAHFLWNALMFGVVGGPISGFSSEGALVMTRAADSLLSGSTFGIEASALSPFAALISLALLRTVFGVRRLVAIRGLLGRHPSPAGRT